MCRALQIGENFFRVSNKGRTRLTAKRMCVDINYLFVTTNNKQLAREKKTRGR